MARRYSVLGQLLVWVIEGPNTVLLRGTVIIVAIGVVVFLGYHGVRGAPMAVGAILGIALLWEWTRRTQVTHYKSVAERWDGSVCPHCGYSLEGGKGEVCPECGTNAPEYMRRVRRHVYSKEPPPE